MAMIGLGLASLLLLKLRKSITRPLQQLTRLMDSVTENNDYSIRADNDSSDEIGILSRGFNKMLKHIQTNDEKLAHELAERYRAEKHLDRLAYYDVITGLPNRHFFHQKLTQVIEHAINNKSLMALLFLDLDNFKTVNDTLGHKTGDLLLKEASSRLSQVVRTSDYICRIGGDEFAIIIENIKNIDDASIVTTKCIECLSKPFVFDGKNFFIGVSIGISVCPNDAITANDLLVYADMAMYEAKLNGKNNYQYYNRQMNVAHSNKYQLESDLRHAIEENQLELYYQPQVFTQSGILYGVEALMRWHHPERGLIGPDVFIPVAEESGLITRIGEWLLDTAFVHAKQIDDSVLKGTRVAVNISAKQMLAEDFIDTVLNALSRSGASATQLDFEITESILMDDREILHSNISKLKALGISIVIDDFGTGFSSMSYLKSFPINMLKIDKSFIFGLPDISEDVAITQAVIAMSHNLNIKVIAEGVEEMEQIQLLRDYDCDFIQGFYYARPMPFNELFKLESGSKISSKKLRMIKGRCSE
jgi:diguanylate cyclase (GGDEF)-like protein